MVIDALCSVHSHLREGLVVGSALHWLIEGGADVVLPMPNTDKGLTTASQVLEYNAFARSMVPRGKSMRFIPTLMITENTTIEEIDLCVAAGIIDGKIFPLERTTKSHNGVKNYHRLLPLIIHCGKVGMKVHDHPEHPNLQFINRDAEFAFLSIMDMFMNDTEAILIWEHGTDARCIPFWKEWAKSGRFFVTLTAHHLATHEDETFGDVRAVCKPPIKTKQDQLGLVQLVEEDHEWVMAGPDDAPHDVKKKHVHEGKCACGAFTSPFLHPLYAHALSRLLKTERGRDVYVNFTSRNARKLHNLPPASKQFNLAEKEFKIPSYYVVGPWNVEPFWAGQTLDWSIEEVKQRSLDLQ